MVRIIYFFAIVILSLTITSCSNNSNCSETKDEAPVLPTEIKSTANKDLITLYQKATAGDAASQEVLGCCYHRGELGLQQDVNKAIEWWTKAADKNDINAQTDLGMAYYFGERFGIQTNKEKGCNWFKKAADNGGALAAFQLACAYLDGVGVKKNLKLSFEYMLKSANAGNNSAMYNLGIFYLQGIYVQKDAQEAHSWLERAANAGNNNAINLLRTI